MENTETEPTEIDKLVVEMFEKAEEMINGSEDKGRGAAEFMGTLMGCVAYFHNQHYPEFSHKILLQGLVEGVLERAKHLRESEKETPHFHITIVEMGNKK